MNTFDYQTTSVVASNMAHESRQMETFPVLIGDEVVHFHRADGGYNTVKESDVINLYHEVQGPGSPYRVDTDQLPHTVEAHMDEQFYYFDVTAFRCHDEYPDEDYVLSMLVRSHMQGGHSFSEPLTADVDRRETRHELD